MSERANSVGTTLAGGIQDIAALLPLLGTDQCEKHVGSALEGGYLYAAATPLSIFGSLGIVKLGISVLISSISIPKLSVSCNLIPHPKISMTFRGRRWVGAKLLDNAGFKPVGTVAPLIAMDGTRYTAETRLLEILKEKHIENPESLSVEWRSTEWNLMLVVSTMLAAVCGLIPYIPFIFLPFRPSVVYSPWTFPLLRSVGSCLAAICCQFLVQSRVISLMKNRIIFMIIDRTLVEDIHSKIPFRWDVSLPSEECLWDLDQYLFSIQVEASDFSKPEHIRNKLLDLRNKHIRTSPFNHAFIFISWMLLLLSLPATVAGYIGCFTWVSGSQGNGPLIWLGLEAALSIIRILLWAWNPRFDESTDITVRLELANDQPLVTTEKNIQVIKETGQNTLALVPERQFLEWITSYTGPLEQFQSPANLSLYFTLAGNQIGQKHHLYLTVFDLNKRIAVTLHGEEEHELTYFDAVVTCNNIASEMEATLQTPIGTDHPWRKNHAILFKALSRYYFSIMRALNRSHIQSTTPDDSPSHQMFLETLISCFPLPRANARTQNEPRTATALLPRKWNLLPKPDSPRPASIPKPPDLTEHDKLYLQRGFEHHLKTKLVENWGRWIVEGIAYMRDDGRFDCHHALDDAASDKAKWELIELDGRLAAEWTRREWSLLESSFDLERILRRRMEKCIEQVVKERQNERLREWMWSEFAVEQRKRMEKEREQAKERIEKGMKSSAERAEEDERAWDDQGGYFCPTQMWEAGQTFIDEQWGAAIERKEAVLAEGESRLDQLVEDNTSTPEGPEWESKEDKDRRILVALVRSRFKHWQAQRRNEKHEMNATIKRISVADIEHLEDAYRYSEPVAAAVMRFVNLQTSELLAKVSAATVYDVQQCNKDVVCDVVQKSTTRTVLNVYPDLVDCIHENDHLLYLSSVGGLAQEPPFIQKNRDRWWDQLEQMGNSSTFYFSPQDVLTAANWCAHAGKGTIAHIFLFLQTRTRLRLRLLHCRISDASVSIQEKGNMLRHISADEIPERAQLQDFELDQLGPGKHELELVVTADGWIASYGLRDIFVEFLEDLSESDKDTEKGDNASGLSAGVENNLRS